MRDINIIVPNQKKSVVINYFEKPYDSSILNVYSKQANTWLPKSLEWISQGYYGWKGGVLEGHIKNYLLSLVGYAAVIAYAISASMVFGLLAYKGAFNDSLFQHLGSTGQDAAGVFLMLCSLIVNVPMSFLYVVKFKDYYQKCREKNWLSAIGLTLLSLIFALLTTLASISLASDAVNGLNLWLPFEVYLTITYLFNTFTTRAGGTLDLLLSIKDIYHWFLARFRDVGMYGKLVLGTPLDEQEKLTFIKRDLDQYGQAYLDSKDDELIGRDTTSGHTTLHQIDIDGFYTWFKGQRLKDQKTGWFNSTDNWWWLAKVSAFAAFGLGLGYLSWTTFPVFLAKTADGMMKSANLNATSWMGLSGLADNLTAVAMFALSNQTFYMINAIKYLPTLLNYWNVYRRIDTYSIPDNVTKCEKNTFLTSSFVKVGAIMLVIAVAAYFSGEGYSREMIAEVKDGFCDAPVVGEFFSRTPKDFPIFAPIIALLQQTMSKDPYKDISHYFVQFFAGLCVNFMSVLNMDLREHKLRQLSDQDQFTNQLSDKEFVVEQSSGLTENSSLLSNHSIQETNIELEDQSFETEREDPSETESKPDVNKTDGSKIYFNKGNISSMWSARIGAGLDIENDTRHTLLYGARVA